MLINRYDLTRGRFHSDEKTAAAITYLFLNTQGRFYHQTL